MLTCPGCGAAAAPSDVPCGYCRARLQTVACASCLGMIFAGSAHCGHCGARVFAPATGEPDRDGDASDARRCPRCAHGLVATAIGSTFLEECGACGGVWVDARSFAELCANRQEQAAYVGAGSPLEAARVAHTDERVRYVKCPDCGAVMNRVNFARWSGVIVDVCKRHGTWFDRDELRQIVEFIRSGGLNAARDKERLALQVEKERLAERQRGSASMPVATVGDEGDFASGFLRWLLRD